MHNEACYPKETYHITSTRVKFEEPLLAEGWETGDFSICLSSFLVETSMVHVPKL